MMEPLINFCLPVFVFLFLSYAPTPHPISNKKKTSFDISHRFCLFFQIEILNDDQIIGIASNENC